MFFYPPMSDCTSLQYGDVRSQDTWLIPSSCLPLPPSIKLGVDSNVFSYSLEANGSVIIHELYKVPSIQLILFQNHIFFALHRFSHKILSQWDIRPLLMAGIWYQRMRISGTLGHQPRLKAGLTWRGGTSNCALCPSLWWPCRMTAEGTSTASALTWSTPSPRPWTSPTLMSYLKTDTGGLEIQELVPGMAWLEIWSTGNATYGGMNSLKQKFFHIA